MNVVTERMEYRQPFQRLYFSLKMYHQKSIWSISFFIIATEALEKAADVATPIQN